MVNAETWGDCLEAKKNRQSLEDYALKMQIYVHELQAKQLLISMNCEVPFEPKFPDIPRPY